MSLAAAVVRGTAEQRASSPQGAVYRRQHDLAGSRGCWEEPFERAGSLGHKHGPAIRCLHTLLATLSYPTRLSWSVYQI